MKDDSDDDKKQQINHIQNLYGFNLFCQKRFDDSMQVFAKLGTGAAQPEHCPPLVVRSQYWLVSGGLVICSSRVI